MANKRVFYAVRQIGFSKDGLNAYTPAHGVQSVGVTTNFNLENVFELGQISLYENIENLPDIQVTAEKVLDGYPLLYHLATNGSLSASLSGRSTPKTTMAMSIFGDAQDSASGQPIAIVTMSGLFCSTLEYQFPVQGNCTESVTLVGNNKVWSTGVPFVFSGQFNNADTPSSVHVQRRQMVIFDGPTGIVSLDANGQTNTSLCTILPPDIDGISSSGINNVIAGYRGAHIQNIRVQTNLGREELLELGRRTPYYRFVTFPIEVTCEIQTIMTTWDNVTAREEGNDGLGNNLTNRTIKVRLQDSTYLNLGTQNKLLSVSMQGGDTGGGNVVCTYNYRNYNDLVVTHPADPSGL